MKKTIRFFAIVAAFAAMAACHKEQDIVEVPVIIEENAPEAASYDPAEYLTGFGAAMEETKAELAESGAFSWSDGDKVKVIRSDGQGALYEYNESESKFNPVGEPLEKNGEPMHAFFPADNFVWDTDHVQFTMPAAFESLTGIMNPMAAVVPADATAETSITLLNLGAIYEIRMTTAQTKGETVTKIELGNTGVNITGSATVSFDGAGTPSIGGLDGEKSVSLEFASPVTLKDEAKSVYFFLPVTGTDEFAGMYVKLFYGKTVDAASYEPFEQKTRNSAMTITRSMRKHMNFAANGFFSGGDGSEGNPYLIASADDFKAIKAKMESIAPADGYVFETGTFFGSTGVHYQQSADIDFGNEALPSIGIYNATPADATPFQGTYDGNNKKLEKFTVSGNVDASVGLFAYVNNATLKNIKVVNAAVTGTNTTGILTGRCIGTTSIENCSLEGGQVTGRNSVGFIAHITGSTTVKGCSVSNLTVTTADSGSAANNQGGVVGFAGGTSSIESCSTSGSIQFTGTASGTARGGIVGKFDSTGEVKACTNGATVTNSLVNQTGGIAGNLAAGTILSCLNTGNVTGTSMVGGIVGFSGSTTNDGTATNICFITSCRNSADITGSANCVGGIAGKLQNGNVVSVCYAEGTVKTSTYDVGGLTGFIQLNNNHASSRTYVYDCLANMNVTSERASGACRTGGAVGKIETTATQYVAVDNCGVLDVTITAGGDNVGGFVGWVAGDGTNSNRARIRNCYTLVSSVPGSSYSGGFVGQMQNKGEFRYDYFVDNSSDVPTATTEDYSKKTADEIKSSATCTTFNSKSYNLTVGNAYSSAKGWAIPDGVDYPVPGALISLGEDYYK